MRIAFAVLVATLGVGCGNGLSTPSDLGVPDLATSFCPAGANPLLCTCPIPADLTKNEWDLPNCPVGVDRCTGPYGSEYFTCRCLPDGHAHCCYLNQNGSCFDRDMSMHD